MSWRKCSRTRWPCSVCSTSGCHCTPARPRSTSSNAATGRDVGRGEDGEARGRRGHRVAVRHPDVVLGRDVGQQRAGRGDRDRGAAVLARAGVGDLAAEAAGHQLEAVAHAEDRGPGREDGRVDGRRALLVDRGRAAGQDDRLRLAGQHLGHRHRVGHDLGVDPRLAHPARDQLGVLRPEVDHQDQIVLRHRRHARASSCCLTACAPAAGRPGVRRDGAHQGPAGEGGMAGP